MSRKIFLLFVVLVLVAGLSGPAAGQAAEANQPRPIPYPMKTSAQFGAAVEAGARTLEGRPGPAYWQQSARYAIEATVDPEEKRVDGTTRIVYHSNAPSPPSVLRIRLHQNLHAEGVPRNDQAEVTGGFDIRRVVVEGSVVPDTATGRPHYEINGTIMLVWLPEALAAGDSATVDIEWSFRIPQAGANGRMGWDADNLIYLAYWYPQVAVFDDVIGWQNDPFLGRAEFHADFADYDVRITVPDGWVVVGTGELANAEEVFAPAVLERLRRAEASDEVVQRILAVAKQSDRVMTEVEVLRLMVGAKPRRRE